MLDHVRISAKVTIVTAGVSGVAALVAIIALWGMTMLTSDARHIQQAADAIAYTATMSEDLLLINRSEYRLGMNPEEVGRLRKTMTEATESFEQAAAKLRPTLANDQIADYDKTIENFKAYRTAFGETVSAAERARNIAMGSSVGDIIRQLKLSLNMATNLTDEVQALAAKAQAQGRDIAERAEQRATLLRAIVAVAALIGIGLGLTVALAVGRKGLSQPIERVVTCLHQLSEGRLDVDIPGTDRKDEIGDIGRAARIFRDRANEAEQLRLSQEREQAARTQSAKRIEALARSFDAEITKALGAVTASAGKMQANASAMSQSAELTSQQSLAATEAADQAAANVSSVALSSDTLARSLRDISQQVEESTRVSNDAVHEAEHAGKIMGGLDQSARKISEIVALISNIAGQTNLLALNATIEAARAGDAGKGFAVVAGEVKGLANQTAKATDDISQQVAEVQNATEQAVKAMSTISSIIENISAISADIAQSIRAQGAATQEIAANVAAASDGTSKVTGNMTAVSAAAEETGHSANDVLVAATDLAREANNMRKSVDEFLQSVKSA